MPNFGEIAPEHLMAVADGLVSDRWQGPEREVRKLDMCFLLDDFIRQIRNNADLIDEDTSGQHPAIDFLFETLGTEIEKLNTAVSEQLPSN